MAPAATNWNTFEVKVPFTEWVSSVKDALETFILWLDVARTVLNTIKNFLVSFGNPLQVLLTVCLSLVLQAIESLNQTGIYWWYLIPNFVEDPSLKRISGGSQAFLSRWKGSLQDAQDVNRPRPVAELNTGGFVLIVISTSGLGQFLKWIRAFMTIFSIKGPMTIQAPPANVKIYPVTNDNTFLPGKIAKKDTPFQYACLEWTVGSNKKFPSSSFEGLSTDLSAQFRPANWLIERTTVYPSGNVTDFKNPGVHQTILSLPNPHDTANPIKTTLNTRDVNGQPLVLMQTALSVSPPFVNLTKLRYIDKTVEVGKQYWYRITPYSGDLSLESGSGSDLKTSKIKWEQDSVKTSLQGNLNVPIVTYPGTDVVMGQSSPLLAVRIPEPVGDFDVLDVIRRVFLAAYSLGFALPVPRQQKTVANPQYNPALPEIPTNQKTTLAVDANGYPIYEPLAGTGQDVGKGSLVMSAGSASGIVPAPKTENLSPYPDLAHPWTVLDVRSQSGFMANRYASLALQAGAGFVTGFQRLMQGPLPFGSPSDPNLLKAPSYIKDATTLQKLVTSLTDAQTADSGYDPGLNVTFSTISPTTGFDVGGGLNFSFKWKPISDDQIRTFGAAYQDTNVRKNVLAAVDYIKTLSYQGQPPDWGNISLNGLFTWLTDLVYIAANFFQGLVDGYNDLMKEVKDFIDLLIEKINVTEKFVEFLISIIDTIESLSLGAYILFVPYATGGVSEWFSAVDGAGGLAPPNDPNGYAAGGCLAWVYPNGITGGGAQAIVTAFQNIF